MTDDNFFLITGIKKNVWFVQNEFLFFFMKLKLDKGYKGIIDSLKIVERYGLDARYFKNAPEKKMNINFSSRVISLLFKCHEKF